ncbi:UNVERIFIED_CONTAM: hypothetical protein HDU68_006446, partial [Siphonaria sp. JEL0065]
QAAAAPAHLFVNAITDRMDDFYGGDESSEVAEAASLLIEQSVPIVPSVPKSQFKMSRLNQDNVRGLWKEFKEGLDNGLSIESLEKAYQDK